jgi:Tol biopolymer transport system component/DNA-binding winged helix-turn-helix (wHTH) protein
VEEAVHSPRIVRFGTFEVDLPSGELRKSGMKLKLTGQPFQVLAILLERPGEVVTREELQKRLWPDTFVDVDHNLNTAINKIREVLGDSAESPRFVETLPRRGYRFIAPVEGGQTTVVPGGSGTRQESRMPWVHRASILFVVLVLLVAAGLLIYRRLQSPTSSAQRALTRLTFDDGLQIGATWSPDGRFIAYSSNRGGKFDIWVQQVSGGDPVQVTKGPGQNWQPDWSPDGKYIAYRSENGDGGLFIVPALGGEGLSRRVAPFGYSPHWSPDSSEILFQGTQFIPWTRFFVVSLDGSPPREILTEFLVKHQLSPLSAGWHPDGKRVSVWAQDTELVPTFWTVPVLGHEGVRSEVDPQVAKPLSEVSMGGIVDWAGDCKFSWAPSGNAIYFERTFRRAKNLWKMTVDPGTLRGLAIERLTTGTGLDSELAISPDGKRLAFTGESQHVGAWLFPFDAIRGRVTGMGQQVTPVGMEAWGHSLTRDGKKLAFSAKRAGRWELWQRSLVDGREAPIVADDRNSRGFLRWSPDGERIAYFRGKTAMGGESQVVVWNGSNEEPLTAPSTLMRLVDDWSPDGKELLISQEAPDTHQIEIWLMSAAPVSGGNPASRKIVSDPAYQLYWSDLSPDGRWIVYQAIRDLPTKFEGKLFITRTSGGPRTQITDGKYWDDKPLWSPDGKAIYFVSGRSGFYNVWGLRFAPAQGKTTGDAFQVTAFENPALMIPQHIPAVYFSLAQDKLVLTMSQTSGSIWVLDNVGP